MKTHLKFLTCHHWPPRSLIPDINSRFSCYSSLVPALQATCPWGSVWTSSSLCGLELPQIPWRLEHLEETEFLPVLRAPCTSETQGCMKRSGLWMALWRAVSDFSLWASWFSPDVFTWKRLPFTAQDCEYTSLGFFLLIHLHSLGP